jgi:hypothetical protein
MKCKALTEAADLNVFKDIIKTLGEYADKFPATGVEDLLDKLISAGVKCIPKDKKAQEILTHVIHSGPPPGAVQKLLNMRFAELPYDLRPLHRSGRRHRVAMWCVDGSVTDKVQGLLKLNSKSGYWSDTNCDKVTLMKIEGSKLGDT